MFSIASQIGANAAAQSQQAGIEAVTDRTAIGLYLVYAVVAIGLVVWLARTLYRNGEVFLADVFEEEAMARAVNHLLVVGFYLLNLGYALLLYKVQPQAVLTEAFNGLVAKLGLLLLSLGVIHLTNMLVFWKIRNHRDGRSAIMPPPPRFQPAPPIPPAGATA